MAEEISIWRWAVTDDLAALMARIVAAPDTDLAQITAEIAGQDPPPESLDDLEARARDKFAAMDLPDEVMETMMAGFTAMMAEAREDAAQEADAQDQPDAEGRMGVPLASSYMFFEDPYASISYEEIGRQVAQQMDACRGALTNALGHGGQSIADYLGITPQRYCEDDVLDALMAAEIAEVEWLWVDGDHAHVLSQWHENKELPIDLEYCRIPLADLQAVKDAL